MMPYWDCVMIAALLFTAIITPYEVTFIEEGPCVTPLFVINRLVDLLFLTDIIVIFNVMYHDVDSQSWVTSRYKISCRYLRFWFWIDILSILPFYLFTWLAQSAEADVICTISGQLRNSSSILLTDNVSRGTQTIKIVKLLRMLKLTRVLKASRVIKRLLQDVLMSKLEMTFAELKVCQLFLFVVLLAHWQACAWALVAVFLSGEHVTWATQYVEDARELGVEVTPTDLYIASLYWSIMTLTSIGYGDFVPMNSIERSISCIFMIVSAVSWTYVLGTAAGIAATLDPNSVQYHTTMDHLNYFMRERELPRGLRLTLREYFQSARNVHQVGGDGDLLQKMSPLLQGTVAVIANKPWLDQIWFLRDLNTSREEREFIAELSIRMHVHAFIAQERMPIGMLYVLRKGMVVKLWRFLGPNSVWGEDMLLESLDVVCHSQAVALTYAEVFTLSKPSFQEAGDVFPKPMAKVYGKMRKVLLRRALLKYIIKANGGTHTRSFISKEQARGYQYASADLSLDKKVSMLLTAQDDATSIKRPLLSSLKTSNDLLLDEIKEPTASSGGGGSSDHAIRSALDASVVNGLARSQRVLEAKVDGMAASLAAIQTLLERSLRSQQASQDAAGTRARSASNTGASLAA